MNAKKRTSEQSSIKIDSISDVSGDLNIAGRDIKVNKVDFHQELFAPVYQAIAARTDKSQTENEDLEAEVKEVETAIREASPDENFIARRIRNIGRIAPDIMDVIVATIASPAAGLGLIGKKIAEKVKSGGS